MCENMHDPKASKVLEKFKMDSRARAIVALSMLELWGHIGTTNVSLIAGDDVYKMLRDSEGLGTAMKSMRIEPKLAYIALYGYRDHPDKMKKHVRGTFELNAILAHVEDLYISDFLPKNSMPVEKVMGLDKPSSAQRIMALEKEVKELKKEIEAIKAAVGNRI